MCRRHSSNLMTVVVNDRNRLPLFEKTHRQSILPAYRLCAHGGVAKLTFVDASMPELPTQSRSSGIPVKNSAPSDLEHTDLDNISLCSLPRFPEAASDETHGNSANVDMLFFDNRSSAVLKSSRMTESVRSLKTNAIFQKGLMPMGILALNWSVTAQMSTIVNTMEISMARSMTAKRGDVRMSSTRV